MANGPSCVGLSGVEGPPCSPCVHLPLCMSGRHRTGGELTTFGGVKKSRWIGNAAPCCIPGPFAWIFCRAEATNGWWPVAWQGPFSLPKEPTMSSLSRLEFASEPPAEDAKASQSLMWSSSLPPGGLLEQFAVAKPLLASAGVGWERQEQVSK